MVDIEHCVIPVNNQLCGHQSECVCLCLDGVTPLCRAHLLKHLQICRQKNIIELDEYKENLKKSYIINLKKQVRKNILETTENLLIFIIHTSENSLKMLDGASFDESAINLLNPDLMNIENAHQHLQAIFDSKTSTRIKYEENPINNQLASNEQLIQELTQNQDKMLQEILDLKDEIMYLKSKLNHNNSLNFIKENSDLKEKIRILEAKASLNQSSSALKVKAPLYQNSPSKMKNSVSCDLNITNQEIEPFQDLFPTDSLKIFYSSCKKQNKPKKIEQVMLVASLSSTIPNLSSKIIEILESTDRGHFIPHGFKPYDDKPQRIGFGATISAPHMHAYTLNWLEKYLKPDIKVLDIGSGSGYLTLCLAKMIGRGKVFGVDHIEELVDQSYTNINNSDPELLDALGNLISIFCKDGRDGLPEYAPFNVIHFGASVNEVSQSIINQLAPGGVIIAPVGPAGKTQVISMIVKDDKGKLSTKTYLNVCYGSLMDKNQQLQ